MSKRRTLREAKEEEAEAEAKAKKMKIEYPWHPKVIEDDVVLALFKRATEPEKGKDTTIKILNDKKVL
jgi:hypothetical protein